MKIIVNHVMEALTLFVAVYKYKDIKHTRYVYFIPFLVFTLMGELGGIYFLTPPHVNGMKNLHIYLVLTMVEIIFIGHQFYEMFRLRKLKQFTLIGSSFLFILLSVWLFFFVDIGVIFTSTLTVLGFFLTCLSCFFLYEKFAYSELEETIFIQLPDFWFTFGILIYWGGSTIPFVLYYFLKENQILILGMPLYRFFPQVFSIFLYGCFIKAILLWKK